MVHTTVDFPDFGGDDFLRDGLYYTLTIFALHFQILTAQIRLVTLDLDGLLCGILSR